MSWYLLLSKSEDPFLSLFSLLTFEGFWSFSPLDCPSHPGPPRLPRVQVIYNSQNIHRGPEKDRTSYSEWSLRAAQSDRPEVLEVTKIEPVKVVEPTVGIQRERSKGDEL